MMLARFLLLLLLLVGRTSAVAICALEGALNGSNSTTNCETCGAGKPWELSCTLYVAPSTIPNAGNGVFTTIDINAGDVIGQPDIIVPVVDQYKALPYRGQQQFLSWLSYIWPSAPDYFYTATQASFPKIPLAKYGIDPGLNGATSLKFRNQYTDERVSAFAPGLASMVNSSPDHVNIQSIKRGEIITFVAKHDIKAGEELFLYYGDTWHKRYEKLQASEREYDTLDEYIDVELPKLTLPTEEEKRASYQAKPRKTLEMDDDDEFDEHAVETDNGNHVPIMTASRADLFSSYVKSIVGGTVETTNNNESAAADAKQQIQVDEVEEKDEEAPPFRSVDWLKANGACIDNLKIKPSKKRGAARFTKKSGAFSKTFIPKNERIAPAPLLVMKWDDLTIYQADESQKAYRNVLNLEKIEGYEEVVNYCYGDKDSELALLPFSPVVNFINHSSKQPNAVLKWPENAPWLDLHPIDVVDLSGKISMDIVALRDIEPDEEILIDFGPKWEKEWNKFRKKNGDMDAFRQELGVPVDFFPETWKHQSVVYELQQSPLEPGQLEQMRWKHNGKVVCKNCYRIGLPKGYSQHFRNFADERGITRLYEKLLNNDILDSNEWTLFESKGEQWFAQQYNRKAWDFNMHYIGAWDESARQSFLRAMGSGGFDVVLESLGKTYGLDNMTCFHQSFMGISEADDSFTHTDIYASDEKGFNIIWPLMVVDGSNPELDIVSDDTNVVLSVNYEYDVAMVMGDWGYHKTSPNSYEDKGQMRLVIGTYCGQIDDRTRKMWHHIYNGEDPAPFCGQFYGTPEIHWDRDGRGLPK